MGGVVTGLHVFQNDVGPESLALLDGNYNIIAAVVNALNSYANYYVDSGAANAIVVTTAVGQTVNLADGLTLQVQVAATNTLSAVTLNINALGAKTVVDQGGNALFLGQLVAGGRYIFMYDGVNFRVLNPTEFWTNTTFGAITFQPPTGGGQSNYTFLGRNGNFVVNITQAAGAGTAFGLAIIAGTTSADNALLVKDQTNTNQYFLVRGDGALFGFGANAGIPVNLSVDTGTFTLTLTGMTAGTTVTARWAKVGNLVMLNIPPVTGTSNATTMTCTGLPSFIQPSAAVNALLAFVDTGAAGPVTTVAQFTISGSVITGLINGNASGWTSGNQKGFPNGAVFAYNLNP